MDHNELIACFVSITQADPERALLFIITPSLPPALSFVLHSLHNFQFSEDKSQLISGVMMPLFAKAFLLNTKWDLEEAVQQYMENPGRYVAGGVGAADLDEDIREAIQPTRSTLIDPEEAQYHKHLREHRDRKPKARESSRTVFEAFRDLQAEARETYNLNTRTNVGGASGGSQAKLDKLAELFKPPLDLLFRGTFKDAKQAAEDTNKLLLVNVQRETEFGSQQLNRDTWKDPTVKGLVKNYFVLWQVYDATPSASEYQQWYKVTGYPHVAILDPKTGEQLDKHNKFLNETEMAAWLRKMAAHHFGDSIPELAATTSTARPPAPRPVSRQDTEMLDLSEDEALNQAIAMSMEEDLNRSGSGPRSKRKTSELDDLESIPESKRRKRSDVEATTTTMTTSGSTKNTPQIIEDDEQADLEAAIALSLQNEAPAKPSEEKASEAAPQGKAEKSKAEVNGGGDVEPVIDENRQKNCTLQLTLPGGKRVQGLFNDQDTLNVVRWFVKKHPEAPKKPFCFATSFPRQVYKNLETSTATLRELGLAPRSVLIVEELD